MVSAILVVMVSAILVVMMSAILVVKMSAILDLIVAAAGVAAVAKANQTSQCCVIHHTLRAEVRLAIGILGAHAG